MSVLALVADDLSGAAESAAALGGLGPEPAVGRVTLHRHDVATGTAGAGVVALDTDSREVRAAEAAERVVAAVAKLRSPGNLASERRVFKKIDSLLRGNTGAELTALAHGGGLIVAPALPSQARTTVDGRVVVDAGRLGDHAAWRLEPRPAPDRVADLLPGLEIDHVGLVEVRADVEDLSRRLGRGVAGGRVVVVDAETDDDLTRIAEASLGVTGAVLAGSGALAGCLGRLQWSAAAVGAGKPSLSGRARGVTVVVGTTDAAAARQLASLRSSGAQVVMLDAQATASGRPGLGPQRALGDVVAFGVRGAILASSESRAALVAALARQTATFTADRDLVLTGGATARAVLDVLGEHTMQPCAVVHPGAVVSVTRAGRVVATRPGSFGGEDSLVQMVRAVRSVGASSIRTDAVEQMEEFPE